MSRLKNFLLKIKGISNYQKLRIAEARIIQLEAQVGMLKTHLTEVLESYNFSEDEKKSANSYLGTKSTF